MENWTFLTNHGHVFLVIAEDPGIRMLDVAARVGITERSAQRIVAELTEGGYLKHSKVGRRNHYEVRTDLPLRHPVERENAVGALLKLMKRAATSGLRPARGRTRRSATPLPKPKRA